MLRGRRPGQRNRETGRGDPAAAVSDLYPAMVPVRESDVWRPEVGERVNWNGFLGLVLTVGPKKARVEFDEPLVPGGNRITEIAIERLRSMNGDKPPAPIKGMTIDAGKAALAEAAKGLALAIHKKITTAEGLRAEYRNMVKVCELLGVPLDELPALRITPVNPKKRMWTLEQREAAGERMAAMNRERRTGRGKVKV